MNAQLIAIFLSVCAIPQAGREPEQPKVPEAMIYNASVPDLKEALTKTLTEQNIPLQTNQSLKNGSIRLIGSGILEKVRDSQYKGPFGILLKSPSPYWERFEILIDVRLRTEPNNTDSRLELMITCRDHEDQEPIEIPREKFGALYQAFYRQVLTNLPQHER
jgi:hypothetical protein